ncbi:MAG: cation:proton antiporter, partial [Candidatus Altiarchaeota archaeon]
MATLSSALHIGFLIGAIAGGFMLQRGIHNIKKKSKKQKIEEEEVHEGLKLVTLSFLAPFFFVNIGLSLDSSVFSISPILLVGTIIVAFAGKILGTIVIKPWTNLTPEQLYAVGWAMNSRGAVELIIALTALSLNLIPAYVFSVLVLTSIVTTATFPFVLRRQIEKNPGVMD